MNLVLPSAGKYVVAVSGGVDSMALLDLLQQENAHRRDWRLTVAHLDHGMRADSSEDRQLVQAVARRYGLPFVYRRVELGIGASEAMAREARYGFLRQVQAASEAQAIITAHHQDDLLETAIINLLRGTGRKGLTALSNRDDLLRPLLGIKKNDLIDYAKNQGLQWREDSSNQDDTYLRNYVRHRLLSRFSEADRQRLLQLIRRLNDTNRELDTLLVKQLEAQAASGGLDRRWFNHLPHTVAREVLAGWLRQSGIRGFDKRTLERLVVAAKVAAPGQQFPVLKGHYLVLKQDHLALDMVER